MPRAVQLLCCSQTGGARAHHSNGFARSPLGRIWFHPTFVESAFDDRQLDGANRHRLVVDAEHAGALAGSGAERPGELGKIIRGMKSSQRFLPTVAVDEVVPGWNPVPKRTTLMTKGNAAVHAACRLWLEALFRP